jgi:redox-sensitive bicupin YhaK (pirin superfamily)
VRLHAAGAALYVARLDPGDSLDLPDAPRLHVFVARGAAEVDGAGRLHEGDAARVTGEGGLGLRAAEPVEALVWALGSGR